MLIRVLISVHVGEILRLQVQRAQISKVMLTAFVFQKIWIVGHLSLMQHLGLLVPRRREVDRRVVLLALKRLQNAPQFEILLPQSSCFFLRVCDLL